MADDKTEATGTDEGNAPEPKAAAEPSERKVPESALTKQAADFNAQIAKLTKQVNSHDAEKVKAKEAKMVEDGKLNDLIAERDKTIAEMKAAAATSSRSLLESSAREQLRNLGMSDALYLQGAIAGLPMDATSDSLEEWAKLMKADNESAFTAPVKVVAQSSVGPPATNGSDDAALEARLKSDDPEVRRLAFSEQLGKELRGE